MTIHKRDVVFAVVFGVILLSIAQVSAISIEEVPEEWTAPVSGAELAEVQERLNEDAVDSLSIIPVVEHMSVDGAVTRTPVPPESSGEYVLQKRTTIGLQPIRGIGQLPQSDVIDFAGESDPYARVTLTIRSVAPITQTTIADVSGDWAMSVVVNALPEGEHTAYLQIESQGARSSEVPVAEFTVNDLQEVSNTTWLFLIAAGFVILFTLVAINIVFLFKRKQQPYLPPPVAEINDELAAGEGEGVEEAQETPEEA